MGGGAEATVGAGLGANALVGGFKKGINLQPLGLQSQTKLNIAAGVESLTLRARTGTLRSRTGIDVISPFLPCGGRVFLFVDGLLLFASTLPPAGDGWVCCVLPDDARFPQGCNVVC
ncbi:MAG: DUF992 domain-containing protein [Hyphomicrobiales bacterium]